MAVLNSSIVNGSLSVAGAIYLGGHGMLRSGAPEEYYSGLDDPDYSDNAIFLESSPVVSGSDHGIIYLSDNSSYLCNSGDDRFYFAIFDSNTTSRYSHWNSEFAVTSDKHIFLVDTDFNHTQYLDAYVYNGYLYLGLNQNNGDNYLTISPWDYGGTMNAGFSGWQYMNADTTSIVTANIIYLNATNTYSLYPASNQSYNLGSSSKMWNYIYSQYAYVYNLYRNSSASSSYVGSSSYPFTYIYGTYIYSSSDRRLKKNIHKLEDIDFNAVLRGINLYSYKFRKSADQTQRQQIGVIAQEIEELMPEKYKETFVSKDENDENGYLSVDTDKFIFLLIGAYQEEVKKREALEDRLSSLEAKVNALLNK